MIKDAPLILRALRKHRTIVMLIVIQIAIACAILGNGLNLVTQRYVLQRLPTGLAEEHLIVLDVEVLQGRLDEVQRDEVLAAVGRLPDVDSTAYINTLPFSGRGSTFKFVRKAQIDRHMDAALYYGSDGFMKTLGVGIIAGRGFVADDFRDAGPNPLATTDIIVLSETLSRRLAASVGSRIEVAGRALTVIGIAQDVMQPVLIDAESAANTAFIPSPPDGVASYQIVIKTKQAATSASTSEVAEAATRITPKTLVWSAQRFGELRGDYFVMDRTVIRLILGLGILLALVVAGGVGGLSSYWIIRRYKQIAIRRALGARRRDIAWYFHVENLIITTMGVVLGFIGAIWVSEMLTNWLALPPMPVVPLTWGALTLIAVGQLAILAPVRRAVAVPPAALKTA